MIWSLAEVYVLILALLLENLTGVCYQVTLKKVYRVDQRFRKRGFRCIKEEGGGGGGGGGASLC